MTCGNWILSHELRIAADIRIAFEALYFDGIFPWSITQETITAHSETQSAFLDEAIVLAQEVIYVVPKIHITEQVVFVHCDGDPLPLAFSKDKWDCNNQRY